MTSHQTLDITAETVTDLHRRWYEYASKEEVDMPMVLFARDYIEVLSSLNDDARIQEVKKVMSTKPLVMYYAFMCNFTAWLEKSGKSQRVLPLREELWKKHAAAEDIDSVGVSCADAYISGVYDAYRSIKTFDLMEAASQIDRDALQIIIRKARGVKNFMDRPDRQRGFTEAEAGHLLLGESVTLLNEALCEADMGGADKVTEFLVYLAVSQPGAPSSVIEGQRPYRENWTGRYRTYHLSLTFQNVSSTKYFNRFGLELPEKPESTCPTLFEICYRSLPQHMAIQVEEDLEYLKHSQYEKWCSGCGGKMDFKMIEQVEKWSWRLMENGPSKDIEVATRGCSWGCLARTRTPRMEPDYRSPK